jgi:hypothetical protein
MTAPLSGQFSQEEQRAMGMFGGPRGVYGPQGTGAAYEEQMRQRFNRPVETGYSGAGYYYSQVPAMYGASSGYAALSTVTGVTMGTPEGAEWGNSQLGKDDTPTGDTVGGTKY